MLRRIERWTMQLGLIFYAGGAVEQGQSGGLPGWAHLHSLVQLLVYGFFIVLAIAKFRQLVTAIVRMRWIFAICVLATASSLWSVAPYFTLRRSLLFWATTLFTVYFASCVPYEEQLLLFYRAIAFEVSLTFLVAILLPSYGISSDIHAGAWKGLFIQKNVLGQFMAFAMLILMFTPPKTIPRRKSLVVLIGATCLLLLSRSSTPAVTVTFVVITIAVLRLASSKYRRLLPLRVALLPILIMGTGLAYLVSGIVLDLIGKDASLTGRVPLWQATLLSVNARPLLGYGYAAFWETRNIYSLGVRTLIRWPGAPYAHNGYLDTVVDIGLVGLATFFYGFISSAVRALLLLVKRKSANPDWPLAFLLFYAICNWTESNLTQTHVFLWLPYVWTYYRLLVSNESTSTPSHQRDDIAREVAQHA